MTSTPPRPEWTLTSPVTSAEHELRLEWATAHLAAAKKWQLEMIREAHADGLSNRAIAKAAGISHEQVRRILSR